MDNKEINEELNTAEEQPEAAEETETAETEAAPEAEPADDKAAEEKASPQDEKIAELEKQLAAEKDKYLRVAAEYDNFRRRSTNDRLNAVADAKANVITEVLSVVDNFERALAAECYDENYKK